jgi:drug/metabolite transporter (DMT)-like permease
MWGTTYLAIRIGVLHFPAFLFAGIRQFVAGIILMAAAYYMNRQLDLSKKNMLRQMLIGFLMLTLGNGMVTWGEKYISSGIAALICGTMPVYAITLNLAFSKKEHFNMLIGAGLVLGVCGVALIFRNNIAQLSDPKYVGGILAVMTATLSWAIGSIINKKNAKPVNAFMDSGMQLFFGGLWMLIISPFADDYTGLTWRQPEALLALGYLIIFGSVLAYGAYMYALSKLPVGIATIYAYINPLVAVILGYLVMDEELNTYIGLAFASIIVSVFLMKRGYRRQHAAQIEKEKGAFPETVPIES